MTINTILNLPLEIDFHVRSFLCEALCTTSSVCKDWLIWNKKIAKILLKNIFPSFAITKVFSYQNQYSFLKKLQNIGDFPKEIIKIIGEFYQFKKLPILEPKGFVCTTVEQMKNPIMVGRTTLNSPCAAFVLRYLPKKHSSDVEEEAQPVIGKQQAVLLCKYTRNFAWIFTYGLRSDREMVVMPKLSTKTVRIGQIDNHTYCPFEQNISLLENIANHQIENFDIALD